MKLYKRIFKEKEIISNVHHELYPDEIEYQAKSKDERDFLADVDLEKNRLMKKYMDNQKSLFNKYETYFKQKAPDSISKVALRIAKINVVRKNKDKGLLVP